MKTSPLSPAKHTRIILISPISSRGPRDLTNLRHLCEAPILCHCVWRLLWRAGLRHSGKVDLERMLRTKDLCSELLWLLVNLARPLLWFHVRVDPGPWNDEISQRETHWSYLQASDFNPILLGRLWKRFALKHKESHMFPKTTILDEFC